MFLLVGFVDGIIPNIAADLLSQVAAGYGSIMPPFLMWHSLGSFIDFHWTASSLRSLQ
jgi:hypothetical protein